MHTYTRTYNAGVAIPLLDCAGYANRETWTLVWELSRCDYGLVRAKWDFFAQRPVTPENALAFVRLALPAGTRYFPLATLLARADWHEVAESIVSDQATYLTRLGVADLI